MMNAKQTLLGYCLKYNNNWELVFHAVQTKEQLSEDDEALVNSFTGNYVSYLDAEYPQRLKYKHKPPFVLYYEGDVSLLKLVDANRLKNDLVFLHGPNTFRIPNDRLVTITTDNKVDICGGLRVWFNKEATNYDRYALAAGLCNHIVGTKIYPNATHSWFIGLSIPVALNMGSNVYVIASTEPSYNNRLIKEGCNLIDCYEDLLSHSPSSDLPF